MQNSEVFELIKKIYPNLSRTTLALFLDYSSLIKLPKGTKLITEGKRHHYFYILIKGCVKSYYLKEDKEVCSWFAFENEMVSTMKTFDGQPSNETIELLEDSELIQINTEKFKKLAETNLAISHLIIELITEHAIYLEDRFYLLQFVSSKERYENLIKISPQLLQRLSLTDIASFLGVSRETLSRIRSQK